jgi:phasin
MSVMTESTKARTASAAASPTGTATNQMPKFGSAEMPASMHEMADKGIAQTKDNLKNAKVATEEASHAFQQAYTLAAKGATDYNLKVFEIARFNANAAFDYAQELLGVKSLSEFVELSTARSRQQFETMTAQSKELATLAQRVSIETAEPLKTGISGAFNKVA